jgi:hypothetical protein
VLEDSPCLHLFTATGGNGPGVRLPRELSLRLGLAGVRAKLAALVGLSG